MISSGSGGGGFIALDVGLAGRAGLTMTVRWEGVVLRLCVMAVLGVLIIMIEEV